MKDEKCGNERRRDESKEQREEETYLRQDKQKIKVKRNEK